MKKIVGLLLVIVLTVGLFSGCSNVNSETGKVAVAAAKELKGILKMNRYPLKRQVKKGTIVENLRITQPDVVFQTASGLFLAEYAHSCRKRCIHQSTP